MTYKQGLFGVTSAEKPLFFSHCDKKNSQINSANFREKLYSISQYMIKLVIRENMRNF